MQGYVGRCKGSGFVLSAQGSHCLVIIRGRGQQQLPEDQVCCYTHLAEEVAPLQKYGNK